MEQAGTVSGRVGDCGEGEEGKKEKEEWGMELYSCPADGELGSHLPRAWAATATAATLNAGILSVIFAVLLTE